MKVYMDIDTGELVEHLPESMLGLEPYSYREAKAAHMRVSKARKEALQAYHAAVDELAAAEREYRVELAKEVVRQETKVGKTNAELAAKGEEKVAAARERYMIADGMKFKAYLALQGVDSDFEGIRQLVSWSAKVSTAPWGEGQ